MRAGQLLEVVSGTRRAVVTEQGAALYRVNWDGAELLDTVTDDGFGGFGCHGQLLMPWPGRITDGVYEFDGESFQLPISDVEHHAAIHGWARWATWQVTGAAPGRIELSCRLLAVTGYPFPLELHQLYAWGPAGLDCVLTVQNIGERPAPFGYGCHPYFSVGSAQVDSDILRVPANSYVPSDGRLVPSGPAKPVDGTELDFRQPRQIGDAVLDATLTELERDRDGRATVELRSSTSGMGICCHYDESISYVQLFTGDTLPFGQRQGIAIEPYTCTPNAFNNGLGLVTLKPGEPKRISWSLAAVDIS
jgi:aldose 1-epimerase